MEATRQSKIPKTIHYFWFGGGEKPESVLKCIKSWKDKCPDFEIKEWNESNYDYHKHPYMEKAFADKKWAFVSDYGRLDVLYQYGGIYLDTDVEVLKDLSPMCDYNAFIGFENSEKVNNGQGFGAVPKSPIIAELMACYDGDEPYEIINGRKEYMESPKQCTKVLKRHGLIANGMRQTVDEFEVFPVDFFCPLNFDTGKLKVTENTYSIHNFDGSWHGKNYKRYETLRHILNNTFGSTRGTILFCNSMKTKDAIKKIARR